MPGKLILDDSNAADDMVRARSHLPSDIPPEQEPWRGGPVPSEPPHGPDPVGAALVFGVVCIIAIWLPLLWAAGFFK